MRKRSRQARRYALPYSMGSRVFDGVNCALLLFFALFCVYPVWYTLINAFSDPEILMRQSIVMVPAGLSLENFTHIVEQENLLRSYVNAFAYTAGVVVYSTALTILGAYVLSRRALPGKNLFMFLIWFTMVFGGGLIPTYLVVNRLKLVNTAWAVILPCAVSQYNLIVMRTAMAAVPDTLEDAARIDGAGDIRILTHIVLPCSLPVVATIALFYCVGQWNSYFKEMIYLSKKETYPLQVILRELLITYTDNTTDAMKMSAAENSNFAPLGFKCAVIFMSLLPMALLYPFIQRFFVKGIMIGAIKG